MSKSETSKIGANSELKSRLFKNLTDWKVGFMAAPQ